MCDEHCENHDPNHTRLVEIDALEETIVGLAARINVATYELLVAVREFDQRAGYLRWALKNTAEWLAWRCDISMITAIEKVRVAHALQTLSRISAEFASGQLSYTKVRAMTRVANRDNEDALVEFALKHPASLVVERCRELRFGLEESTSTAQRALANRSLTVRRNAEKGTMTITVELPLEKADVLNKALDKACDDECLEIPDLIDTSWSARQADAFMNMVNEYLDGGKKKNRRSSDRFLVTVHVDQKALSENVGRSALPIETVKRLCCDNSLVVMTETEEGQPLSIGRKSRVIPPAIERAVRARDNHTCCFPGCNHRRFTECHHIEHWANNGETCEGNLMLLCDRHHTLVHEGGFRIEKDFMDDWIFVRPDGVAIPNLGYQVPVTAEFRPEGYSPAGESLRIPKNRAHEPPPPLYLH